MGEPRQPTVGDRTATRKLCAAIVESVRADEAMPLGLSICPIAARMYRAHPAIEVEAFAMQLAQEVVTLERELKRAIEASTRVVELTRENCNHNREIDPVSGECADCGEVLP